MSISCGRIGHETWLTFLRPNWRSEPIAARFLGWKDNFGCQVRADGLDARCWLTFIDPNWRSESLAAGFLDWKNNFVVSISCEWIGRKTWLTFVRPNRRSESIAAWCLGWKYFRCQFLVNGSDMGCGLHFFATIGGPNLSLLGSLARIISPSNSCGWIRRETWLTFIRPSKWFKSTRSPFLDWDYHHSQLTTLTQKTLHHNDVLAISLRGEPILRTLRGLVTLITTSSSNRWRSEMIN